MGYNAVTTSLDNSFAPALLSGLFAVGGFFIFAIIMAIAVNVVMIIAKWKIFTKAGKPGWAAIIPVYNLWVMLELVGLPGWISLFSLGFIFLVIPFLNFIGIIVAIGQFVLNVFIAIRLAPLFEKESAFVIGLILLPVVFYPMLAFGKTEYVGEVAAVTPPVEPPVE